MSEAVGTAEVLPRATQGESPWIQRCWRLRSLRSLHAAGWKVGADRPRATGICPPPPSPPTKGNPTGPLLLLQEGAWLAQPDRLRPPPGWSDESAPPVWALGLAVESELWQVAANSETGLWRERQSRCGGDFSRLSAELGSPPAAWWLNASAARQFLAARQAGSLTDEIWCSHRTRTRLVRWAGLDAFADPRLRVVQVVTSRQRGGAERIALDLTKTLRQLNTPTLLATLGQPGRGEFPALSGTLDLAGLKDAHRWPELELAATVFGADLWHGHLLTAEQADRLAALGEPRWPLAQTIHNTRAGWPIGLAEQITRVPGGRNEPRRAFFACARAVEIELRAPPSPHLIRTVWNGVDVIPAPQSIPDRTTIRRQWGLSDDAVVLLTAANPRPQKRLDRTPPVLTELQRRLGPKPQVHWLLAGEAAVDSVTAAQCLTDLRQAADVAEVADRLHFLGPIDNLAPVFAGADLMLCLSAHEGLSLAQLEALAAGLPVVTTDVGGAREVAAHSKDVHLVPADATPVTVAEAVQHALSTLPRPATAPRLPKHFTTAAMTRRYRWWYDRWLAGLDENHATPPRSGLALVTNNFATGGAQSSARRLLVELARRGHRVRAFTLQELAEAPSPGTLALRAVGISVVHLPPPEFADSPAAVGELLVHLASDPPVSLVTWNALAHHKLCLADAWSGEPNPPAWFDVSPGEMFFDSLERALRLPPPGLPTLSEAEYGAVLRGVIVKYAAEASRAARLGAPVLVIPNGVLLLPVARPRSRPKLILGTAARLHPHKRLDLLLDAFRRAQQLPIRPAWELHIAGGPEPGFPNHPGELQALATGLPVRFLGEISDIPAFLATLDIFVSISEPAGCPNAALEAMSAGLPVIATDHGGGADQIQAGQTGRLVPRHDPPALAAALLELAREPELRRRLGEAGRSRLATEFSLTRMADRYEAALGLKQHPETD